MKASDPPIIVEAQTNASINSIWRAMTLLAELRQWLFEEIPSFVAEVGFTTEFDIDARDTTFRHVWIVKEVIDKQKITVEWSYSGHEGKGDVTYEIIKKQDHKLIRLTNTVIEDFDDNIPEFRRQSALSGWNYLIKERLVEYLT